MQPEQRAIRRLASLQLTHQKHRSSIALFQHFSNHFAPPRAGLAIFLI